MKAVSELIWAGSYGSTTVDQICERAGVNKGSFYYFFKSKADLATRALDIGWEEYREKLDRVFSASIPPLERIHHYCEMEYEQQADLKERYGSVLGCPLCTLGAEISTLEPALREKVDEIMGKCRRYFETTLRDAHAAGHIAAPEPLTKAAAIYSFIEGLLTQARIRNELEMLRDMERGVLDMLGLGAVQRVPEPA